MKDKFYLTTAITYASSVPHIGNVYEAILSDSIVRYKRKMGFDVYFQTGTDEHGQKIENKALDLKETPQKHVDDVSNEIKRIYKMMNINYDNFIRTTDEDHMKEVQAVFKKLFDQGDIYKGYYEGWYCVDCESYFTEKDLVDGCCPDCGAKVHKEKEEAYFMNISKYQDRLIEYINTHPEFIEPEARKNEMVNNFLKDKLPDLCVSRTSYKWGVPVSFDEKHVIYVWIDALLNYITGIGYHQDSKSEELFQKFWPCDVHIIGKDILRFHTIYWPIILMTLDLPLPKKVFGHPWILVGDSKMSKSKGNVIYTDDLVRDFGVDRVRYFVLHEMPYVSDGSITYELLVERSNSDLANTFGNLVNRSLAMTKKYFDGAIKKNAVNTEFDADLENEAQIAVNNYQHLMDNYRVSDAIEAVLKFIRRTNKYVDETAPWILAKEEANKPVLENVLYHLLEAIRIASVLLENIIPTSIQDVYQMLNTDKTEYTDLSFGGMAGYQINEAKVLFNRIDIKDIVKEKDAMPAELPTNLISIEDFDKIELVVGKIVAAKKHPKADKLLVFKVDIKTEIRQIVSGIAKFYPDFDSLIGKKVVVVKNLKPIVLRGEESKGMLLCAADAKDNNLELLNIEMLEPGDIVR